MREITEEINCVCVCVSDPSDKCEEWVVSYIPGLKKKAREASRVRERKKGGLLKYVFYV